ncbi:hypothetical protein HaLaN_03385 [Haematococcus lacustris]|uniref:Uncharacterized protein n=1 Tax=Haematococcus lacustris TaxID=44745 RepID=A0A699YEB0_HAELA|nr:hypothetical protein HaLaN_03385 [Haematococcus lacustris]
MQRLRNISPVFAAAKDRLAATLAADGHGDAQLLLQGWAASSEAAEAVAKTRPYRYGALQWPLLVDAVSKRLRVVLQSTLSGQGRLAPAAAQA